MFYVRLRERQENLRGEPLAFSYSNIVVESQRHIIEVRINFFFGILFFYMFIAKQTIKSLTVFERKVTFKLFFFFFDMSIQW
jgi:hypothetical protein